MVQSFKRHVPINFLVLQARLESIILANEWLVNNLFYDL